MEKQTAEFEKNTKSMFIPICITQTVCITVILIGVLIIKMFFESSYKKIEKWYTENILDQTTITAVFEEE